MRMQEGKEEENQKNNNRSKFETGWLTISFYSLKFEYYQNMYLHRILYMVRHEGAMHYEHKLFSKIGRFECI